MPREEVLGQRSDVRSARSQRMDLDVDPAQAEEEISPKPTCLDQFSQALVRRHDNPRVDFPRRVSPHPLYGSLLDCPQQLGLCGRSQVGDLVEEKGSAAGQFKLSPASTYAGRGAVLDPE